MLTLLVGTFAARRKSCPLHAPRTLCGVNTPRSTASAVSYRVPALQASPKACALITNFLVWCSIRVLLLVWSVYWSHIACARRSSLPARGLQSSAAQPSHLVPCSLVMSAAAHVDVVHGSQAEMGHGAAKVRHAFALRGVVAPSLCTVALNLPIHASNTPMLPRIARSCPPSCGDGTPGTTELEQRRGALARVCCHTHTVVGGWRSVCCMGATLCLCVHIDFRRAMLSHLDRKLRKTVNMLSKYQTEVARYGGFDINLITHTCMSHTHSLVRTVPPKAHSTLRNAMLKNLNTQSVLLSIIDFRQRALIEDVLTQLYDALLELCTLNLVDVAALLGCPVSSPYVTYRVMQLVNGTVQSRKTWLTKEFSSRKTWVGGCIGKNQNIPQPYNNRSSTRFPSSMQPTTSLCLCPCAALRRSTSAPYNALLMTEPTHCRCSTPHQTPPC